MRPADSPRSAAPRGDEPRREGSRPNRPHGEAPSRESWFREAWYRDSFNDDYRALYAARDEAQAAAEVAFAIHELSLRRGDDVLDLCCGFGRHLVAFARAGIRATGVDLSMQLLRQVPASRLVRPVCADMRHLPLRGGEHGFGCLVNFFTSFGYFERDEDHVLTAREMARVLRPGGRFLMDLMNAERTVRDLQPRTERLHGRFRIREQRRYDPIGQRIEKRTIRTDEAGGATREYFESVRLFSPEEIRTLLARAGLEVDRLAGSFEGEAMPSASPRMIVVGRSRSRES